MSILDIVKNFLEDGEQGERAAFEAAMEKRIRSTGYTTADLIFEVYRCQSAIRTLSERVAKLEGSKKAKKDLC
jgi:hypothetical protein